MKKKIFLIVAIVAAMCCIFAISASAAVNPEYLSAMTDGMTQVTLADGTVCDLYDDEGYALSYYKDSNGVLTPIRSEDLVYNLSGTKLHSIALADGTVLTTTASNSQKTNKLVVANLRCTEITDFNNDNMFKENGNALQYIFMPDTIENLVSYAFGKNNNLKGCYFSANSSLTTINGNTFLNCTNLGGFYIPSGVTTIGGSAFSNCNNVYFVSDPANIATKPAIYTFPAGLNKIEGETFKFCYKMNDTIVFGTGITNVPNNWALAFFDNVARNVVFLGQFTSFETSNQVKNTSFYFANKNVSLTPKDGGSNNKFYFCSEGSTHLYLVNETLAADCENNAKTQTRCFCGKVEKMVEEPNTALGHDHDYVNGKATLIAIEYSDYSKAGTKTVKCGNCGKEAEIEAAAILIYKGYSKNDKGGVCVGYRIDQTALVEYETFSETTISYGFAVAANNANPLDANGNAVANAIKVELSDDKYTAVDFVLTAKDWTTGSASEAKLSINMYVIVNNAVKYITANGYSDTAEEKTYAEI